MPWMKFHNPPVNVHNISNHAILDEFPCGNHIRRLTQLEIHTCSQILGMADIQDFFGLLYTLTHGFLHKHSSIVGQQP